MLKKHPTKSEVRSKLDRQVEEFLMRGGEVQEVQNGISGDDSNNPWQTPLFFKGTQQDHTPITHLYKVIDARKRKSANSKHSSNSSKPKKHWIYDDFGEPIRWVWKD